MFSQSKIRHSFSQRNQYGYVTVDWEQGAALDFSLGRKRWKRPISRPLEVGAEGSCWLPCWVILFLFLSSCQTPGRALQSLQRALGSQARCRWRAWSTQRSSRSALGCWNRPAGGLSPHLDAWWVLLPDGAGLELGFLHFQATLRPGVQGEGARCMHPTPASLELGCWREGLSVGWFQPGSFPRPDQTQLLVKSNVRRLLASDECVKLPLV